MIDAQVATAIVTGAGSGIGRQTAILLAEAGYRVGIASRRNNTLEKTASLVAERTGTGDRCVLIPTDVCNPNACAELVRTTVEQFGRLDVLVHAAGYAILREPDQNTPDQWRQTIDTNLSAAVYLTAAAWAYLQADGGGLIVNVSSIASTDPFPRFGMYATAKAGLNMFTRCTAREGEAAGVCAVCIAPGAVETPMLRSLFDETKIPRDRTLDPADVAAVIRDCAIGKHTFRSGETIQLPSP